MGSNADKDPPITATDASAASAGNGSSDVPRPGFVDDLAELTSHPTAPTSSATAIIDTSETSSLSPKSVIIDPLESSSASKSFVRGHRRRSTRVTRSGLSKFRREVLGVDDHWDDEEDGTATTTPTSLFSPQFDALNRDFERAAMSLNSGNGVPGGGPGAGIFSSYAENQSNSSMPSTPRQSMSSSVPHTPGQMNGGGMPGMNGGMPMNAGHQMDLHHLYEMVLELSDVLKNNREVTKSIVNSAEEIMKRSATDSVSPSLQQVNGEITGARIAELERSLAKEKRLVEILKHEQVENTKLIGEYEAAVGTMVEQIRNYCQNNNMHFLAQKRHYNDLLQAERDAHLESRLDRDYWHAQTMKCAEMIRVAHRLRCEEEDVPIRIVSGLQNEVRAYRNALGMEPEKREEEYGWEILKDLPPSVD